MSPAPPARNAHPSASRAPGVPPGLAGHTTDLAGELLLRHWKRYRKAQKRCQDKFTPEAIHSFRIETRRLLSCLELLGPLLPPRRTAKVQRLLKRRLDLFGDLRDTQVQLETLAKMRHNSSATQLFQCSLHRREQRFTRRTHKQIRKARARRLVKLMAECREGLETRIKDMTPRKAFAVLLRSAGCAFRRARQLRERINPRDPATIHHTRVAFKKFRYMVEALAEHLPLATPRRLTAMHRYQTMMGNIQDAEVLLGALDGFLRKEQVKPAIVGRFRAQLLRRRQRLIRTYLRGSGRLLEFWPLPARMQPV